MGLLTILLTTLLFALSGNAQGAPKVVATLKPVHSLLAGLMQGVAEPQLLLGDSQSPHSTSLKPSQIRMLNEADLIVWVGAVWTLQRRLLFPRWAMAPAGAARPGPGVEVVTLQTPAGPVEAWLLAGDGTGASRPGPAVIFAHGNAELIDDWSLEMRAYTRLGVTVLLPEYRGYGRSAGSPSPRTAGAFRPRINHEASRAASAFGNHGPVW